MFIHPPRFHRGVCVTLTEMSFCTFSYASVTVELWFGGDGVRVKL